MINLNHDEFAKMLMSEERKSWQDPELVLDAIGVTPGSTVVDIACGPGYFTIPCARKTTRTAKVYAVDSNPTMINHLKKNLAAVGMLEAVEVMQTDASKTEIPNEAAYYVLIANVLHDI